MIDARARRAPFTRDVHSKAHGCVRPRSVAELEPRLRHGLFARGPTGVVRFSSGDTHVSPTLRDARGFALKVMGCRARSFSRRKARRRRTS
jgi:catalase